MNIDLGMSLFYPPDPQANLCPRRWRLLFRQVFWLSDLSTSRAFPSRGLCKVSPFAQFLRQAQILILKILNVCLRLKFSPSLNLTKIEHFSQASPIKSDSGNLRCSSPITAAGPSPIYTGFPIKLLISVWTVTHPIKKKWMKVKAIFGPEKVTQNSSRLKWVKEEAVR